MASNGGERKVTFWMKFQAFLALHILLTPLCDAVLQVFLAPHILGIPFATPVLMVWLSFKSWWWLLASCIVVALYLRTYDKAEYSPKSRYRGKSLQAGSDHLMVCSGLHLVVASVSSILPSQHGRLGRH